MKYPTKLSDAVHILAFIALHPDASLTSEKIAESIQTNPGYVRQLMSALRKGGLLNSVKGHPRPVLAKEPCQITLLDAYRAVEGDKPPGYPHQPSLRCRRKHPACPAGLLRHHTKSCRRRYAQHHIAGNFRPLPGKGRLF